MARGHYADYPSLDLEEAIDKVRAIFEREQTHAATREVLAKAMGYTGVTGTSAKVLASLKRYGLLDGRGENLRVSDDAVAILVAPKGDTERGAAVHRCAFAPPLFAELRSRYGADTPSDDNLRYFLIKQGISQGEADTVVGMYKRMLTYVRENGGSESSGRALVPAMGESATEQSRREHPFREDQYRSVEPSSPVAQDVVLDRREILKYRISKNSSVELRFDGSITSNAISKLIQYLELAKEDYPEGDAG